MTQRSSVDVGRELEQLRSQLETKQKTLLERKDAFIRQIQLDLQAQFDRARDLVISDNAEIVEKMSQEDLVNLKKRLVQEKPRVIQKAIDALATSPYWFESSVPVSRNEGWTPAIDEMGVVLDGPIWKAADAYRESVESLFIRSGLTVEKAMSPFRLSTLFGMALNSLNKAIVPAYREYCDIKNKVTHCERELVGAKAREKFASV